ncbi:MAG: right-handed parallel beta-helix repeat-containing protein [Planctomycetes bacterium]|nr:right-handed parallel beta-helix repeat-containing protein [Planctomycetota bacterium]
MLLRTIAILFTLLTASPLAATTYFVSPTGNDAADGRSATTAWRTIEPLKSVELAPGDSVAFARGGVWRSPLEPRHNGTAEAPIVFTAYGDGLPPRFDGSDEVPSAREFAAAQGVNAILLNGVFLRTPADWKLEGETLRLAAMPTTASVRLVRRENMVNLQQVEHIVLRGLWADATAKPHGGYGFRIEGCRNVTLEDCLATRGGKHHFGVINSTDVVLRRCRAELVMPDQGVGGASAFVSFSDRRRQGDVSRYEDCVVQNYRDATEKGQYAAFVTHGEGIGEITITGLVAYGAGFSLNNRESGAKLRIVDSFVEDASVGIFGNECEVSRVTLRRGVLTLDGEANRISGCQVIEANPGFLGYQSAVVNTGRRNVLEDCTIRLDPAAKSFNAGIALVHPQSELTWRNCRFASTGSAVRTWFEDVSAAGCRAVANHYPSATTFIVKGAEKPLSVDEWRALGFDQP